MRIEYFKTLIDTEIAFENLTEIEQIQLIMKLVEDVNLTHPWAHLQLIRMKDYDGSLDW